MYTDFIRDSNLDFVGFQETKKEIFHDSFFKHINNSFTWPFLRANGTASGILVDFNEMKFGIIAWKVGKDSVAVIVRSCHDNFIWRFINLWFPV